MVRINKILIAFIVAAAAVVSAIAQAPRNSVVSGDVLSVDQTTVVLKTAEGELKLILTDKTEYKRVPPENPVLKAAVTAALTDIGVGDKLMVTGMMADDKKSMPAKAIYVMTKADISQRQSKEKERWSTRGISGRVTAVNQDTKQITVEMRSLGSATNIVLTPKSEVKYLRYAPNSVSYNEAVASRITDIGAGDMIRAVGDRSPDGASFAAEEVVTGAFQTIAGTVKAVDAEKNEVVITDLQSKKDVTVSLGAASVLKKFPEQMAQMLAARQMGGGAGAPAGQGGGQMAGRPGGQPGGAPGGGRPGGMGGQGGAPRGGIDEMLERFPNITATDLKVGDMIAVSSSRTASIDRITAIKLLAGVEPFIRAAQMSSGGSQGRGQGSQSLNIPGLDGFDTP